MMTKRAIAIFFVLALCTSFLIRVVPNGFAQAPPYSWYQTYGGTGDDEAHCIIRTSDGGYAIAGWTKSFGLTNSRGWLVKTDASGRMMWNKTYGGQYESAISSVIQTSDGGYALAGSSVRQVSMIAWEGVPWLVKTDSDGNVVWEQAYTDLIYDAVGAYGEAGAHCIIERPSGGFVLGGKYQSTEVVAANLTIFIAAFWIVTDTSGNITNSKVYGAEYAPLSWESSIASIIYSGDGGYFLAGGWVTSWMATYPAGGGGIALWKIDGNGNLVWGPSKNSSNYVYGGTEAYSLTRGSDGSLLLAGYTNEWVWNGLNSGYYNFPYIVRVDSSGNQFAGSGKEIDTHEGEVAAVISTSDGGYVLAGRGKGLISGMGWSFWLLKIDSTENLQWNQTFDLGPGDENAYSMASTTTGGYMVAGSTNSVGAGGEDFLIVDFGPASTPTIQTVGGYSYSLASLKGYNTALPSSFYFTIVTMLAVVFTAIRRKRRQS